MHHHPCLVICANTPRFASLGDQKGLKYEPIEVLNLGPILSIKELVDVL